MARPRAGASDGALVRSGTDEDFHAPMSDIHGQHLARGAYSQTAQMSELAGPASKSAHGLSVGTVRMETLQATLEGIRHPHITIGGDRNARRAN